MPPPRAGADATKKKKIKLPSHLLKKVKTAGYDPEHDTSLTDDEIALLTAWKQAKEGGGKKKRRKKTPPGVFEDLSDMPGPELDTSKLDMEAIQAGRAADEIDMKRLLFPRGKVPIGTKNFLTYYSPAVLDGYVMQTSPACAAASTASAWNGLMAWHRHNKSALNQDKVVAVMKDALEEMLDGRKDTMVQKLAGAQEPCKIALQLFLDKFSKSMSDEGMMPFCWDKGGAKTDLLPRLVRVCSEPQVPESTEAAVFKQILEWVRKEEERQVKRAKKDAKAKAGEVAPGEDAPHEEGGQEHHGAEGAVAAEGAAGAEGAAAGGGGGGNFGLLLQVITHMGGFMKITAPRPSTSFFGNDGISQAVKRLSDGSRQVDMSSNPYMGKAKGNDKSAAEVRLTDKDSMQTIDDQWSMFREEFLSYNSTFLFHQINHYSLIYGMREWVDYRGRKHRQVLTAKRGQRPTAWLTYEEVRRILLSWHGYKIIKITRIFPRDFVGDWKVGGQVTVYKGPPRVPTPPEEDVHWDLDVFFGRKKLSDVARDLHKAAAHAAKEASGGGGGGGKGKGKGKKKIKKKSSGIVVANLGALIKKTRASLNKKAGSSSSSDGGSGGSSSSVQLPDYLEKKVSEPGYDMDADTSLTDDDLALLEDWKAGGGAVPDKVEELDDLPAGGGGGGGGRHGKPSKFGSELSVMSGGSSSRSARSRGSKSSRSSRSNSSGGSGSQAAPPSPRLGLKSGGRAPSQLHTTASTKKSGKNDRRASSLSSAPSSARHSPSPKSSPKGSPRLTNKKAAAAKKAILPTSAKSTASKKPAGGGKMGGNGARGGGSKARAAVADSDDSDDNSADNDGNGRSNGNGNGNGDADDDDDDDEGDDDDDDTPTKKKPSDQRRGRGAAPPAAAARGAATKKAKATRRPLISKDDSDDDDSSSSDDDSDGDGGDAPSRAAPKRGAGGPKKLPALASGRKAGGGNRRRISAN